MEKAPTAPMPTFDGAGWLNSVKILKVQRRSEQEVADANGLPTGGVVGGAKLEVVVPSIPKAKVLFPQGNPRGSGARTASTTNRQGGGPKCGSPNQQGGRGSAVPKIWEDGMGRG